MSRRSRQRRNRRTPASTIFARLAVVFFAVVLILAVVGVASAFAVVQSWLKDLPDYKAKDAFQVAQATRIYSADGRLLARLYLQNRDVVPISEISTDLVDGIVAVEDERYYQHPGVDPVGIIRAVVTNVTGGDRQGASTITQQYIRATLLLDERTQMTLARKVREAYLAMELEKRYSKREILEMYLNTIYLGESAYGAQAAARTYFGTSARELTLAQAALIAGLAQSPSRLDPYDNPDGAVARRNEVLGRMLFNKYITKEQYDQAIATPLELKRVTDPLDGIYYAPYYVAHVKKVLQAQFTPSVVFQGGLTVYTTLDTRLQDMAEKSAHSKFNHPKDPEVALVAIDPRNGYVKAMVGGRSYAKNKFNMATQAHRQPGSSFKMFVLVTALEQGMPPWFDVDSSSPAVIPSKPKAWTVDNSEGSGHGMMSLETATHLSVNTVFARVAWEIGIKNIAKTAARMGIKTPIPNYPSIALGAQNVTPYEMASAYTTLANSGVHYDPIVVTKVVDRTGATIFEARPKGTQAVKPGIAYVANDILKGVITQGTASRAGIGRPAAGKTGTSQSNRDVWFVGYTPQLCTAVWVGYPTERTIIVDGSKAFGGTVAAPIWASFMKKALAGVPKRDFPKAKEPKWTASKFDIPVSASAYETKKVYVYSSKPKGTVLSKSIKGGFQILTISKGPAPSAPPPSGGGGTPPGGGGSGDTSSTP